MRKMIAMSLLFVGFSAQAEGLVCIVPVSGGAPSIAVNITVESDTSSDFVVLDVVGAETEQQFFTQLSKGEVAQGLAQGQLAFLVVSENFQQGSNGVIHNAGFFVATRNAQGTMDGLLSAGGNVYPLSCQAH